MFTVKHIDGAGRETLYSADKGLAMWGSTVTIERWGAEDVVLSDGRAYVMNAAGKTVADYRLGAVDACSPLDAIYGASEKLHLQTQATLANLVNRPARDERLSDDVKREPSDEVAAAVERQKQREAERRQVRAGKLPPEPGSL